MKALWFSGLIAVTLLMGCGSGNPVIESPADGQQFSIRDTPAIQVTIANQDYQNVSISFRGTEAVPEFQWQNAVNAPATAYKVNQAGGFGTCTAQRPCTVFIIATKGDHKDFRTITFVP